ncbi:MAG: hypothetical protein IPO91_12190 [Chloroflexi bacterium]|nr:hypothetical protein [Chloroflexota bacterium]
MPEASPDHIRRPRLTNQLHAGLAGKLTLIAAPAGSGKTTVIADWFASETGNVALAWLALDAEDNDPARFLRYLIAAFEQVCPTLNLRLDGLSGTALPEIKSLLTELLNQIGQSGQRVVLALDDYHVIENPDLHRGMIFLLDYLPLNLHMILTTRSDPPFPLARLRARRQMTEIRAADLRFSLDETDQFLNQGRGLKLVHDDIAAIEQRTEGWIAGVQLAALSLRGRNDVKAFIQAFTGSNRYIAEYLVEEVFNQLTEALQSFLLKTAVVERFCAPLCSRLTGIEDSAPILDTLWEMNLFLIPLDDDGTWYRYHHLFAELLRFRLRKEYPEAISELYQLASGWCDEQGLSSEAIHYALAGEHWDQAARLIERYSDYFWVRGELKRLLRWSDQLPPEVVEASAGLCVLKAWTMLPAGALRQMETYLSHAENALSQADDPGQWRGRILSLRAFMRRILDGGDSGYQLTIQAKAALAPDDVVWQAFTTMNLTSSAMMRGDLPALLDYNDQTIALARQANDLHTLVTSCAFRAQVELDRGSMQSAASFLARIETILEQYHAQWSPLRGFAHIAAGRIAYERDELESARRHFDAGLERGQEGEVADIIIDGLIWSARLRQTSGQFDRAQQYLDQLAEQAAAVGVPWLVQTASACQAWQHLLTERLHLVESWVARHAERIEREPIVFHWWFQIEQVVLVRAYLALTDFEAAYARLTQLIAAAEQQRQFTILARLYVLLAVLDFKQGRPYRAQTIVSNALELAAPEGYVRVFLDELAALQPILKAVSHPFAARILQVERDLNPAKERHPDLLDPLSERELEVLRLLPEGLSNLEMAEQFFVSVNTVKWYLKEIYSKLGVGNRTQAIERARELHLIA